MKKLKQSPVGKPHLGGHGFKTHLDQGILNFFKDNFNIKSMLDIGCGPGGMVDLAIDMNIDAYGIDGDDRLTRKNANKIIIHDFSDSSYIHTQNFDLGYSCEFVEHVEEKYVSNFMPSFQKCKHILLTFAPIGTKGHHHVNCNTQDYWINTFKDYGFTYDNTTTVNLRKVSTMKRDFIRNHGLYFLNSK